MKVTWLVSATASLRGVHAHIAVEDPAAARRVVQAIRATALRLKTFPESGRLGPVQGTRELVISNLPYIAVYRLREGRAEIIRVFHTATEWRG